jgi:hypothetical protein
MSATTGPRVWPSKASLGAALTVILQADLNRQIEQMAETRLELGLALDLAADVADHPAQADAQQLEGSTGALELVGMGVTADHDGGTLGNPPIALAQHHALVLGELDQPLQSPMHEAGVGRVRDRLGLYRGVHRDALEILGCERAQLVRHR